MKKIIFLGIFIACYAQMYGGVKSDTSVVINELMADNETYITDEYGEYNDWFELYNNTDQEIHLAGYFLTDNPEIPDKFEILQGTIIASNGYLIFWADEDGTQGPNHCNFKLSAGGETIMLLNPDLDLVDSVNFGQQITDMSYARVPNGTGNFIIQLPTFNATNNLPIGTNEIETDHLSMKIYPVPADDCITILVFQPSLNQQLEIRNLMGQVIYTKQVQTGQNISTSAWPSGLYLVRAGNEFQKIFIRH